MKRPSKRDGRKLAGVDAITWLKNENNHVSGRFRRKPNTARHDAMWAVRMGWLLVVQPDRLSKGWARIESTESAFAEGREWAQYVECPACGHALAVGQTSRILLHCVRAHNDAAARSKFVEIPFEEFMRLAYGIEPMEGTA